MCIVELYCKIINKCNITHLKIEIQSFCSWTVRIFFPDSEVVGSSLVKAKVEIFFIPNSKHHHSLYILLNNLPPNRFFYLFIHLFFNFSVKNEFSKILLNFT